MISLCLNIINEAHLEHLELILNNAKTIIILPHLDDEFSITPLLDLFARGRIDNVSVVFCAERLGLSNSRRKKRRNESLRSMKMFNINKKNIFYLNDLFLVDDLKLFDARAKIYDYLKNLIFTENFKQIITLSYEGGNPDHDFLALIVAKVSNELQINSFYFPAYNYDKFLFFPVKVLKPLKTQLPNSHYVRVKPFCWYKSIFIVFIYLTEINAFIKLLPFLIIKTLFSDGFYYMKQINIKSVNWSKSISFKKYKVKSSKLKEVIEFYF